MSALKDTGCRPQAHGQSAPGGGPCPRCDRPRCCATAKTRDNERCRKNPHPGASICTNHGLTKAGRAAAERRREVARAEAEVIRLGLRRDVDAHTALLEELQESAGAVEYYRSQVSAGSEQDSLVERWHQERDRKLKAAEACIRAGIEERKQRLAEQAGAQLAAVIRAVVEALQAVLVEALGPYVAAKAAFDAVWAASVLEIVPRELRRLSGPEEEGS